MSGTSARDAERQRPLPSYAEDTRGAVDTRTTVEYPTSWRSISSTFQGSNKKRRQTWQNVGSMSGCADGNYKIKHICVRQQTCRARKTNV